MTPQPVLRCASDGRGSVPFFWKAVKETGLRDDGLVTLIGGYAVTRDAANGLPTNVAGGALSLSRTFNGYGEVSAQTATVNGVAAGTLNLTYDDNGQIVTKSETVNGVTANYAYTYDAQGRLLTVQKGGTLVEEYRYNDPIHPGLRTYEMNTLRGIVPGRSLSYNSEDQLQSNVASTFHYDPDGNVDQVSGSWGTAALTYSTRGELLSVTMPGGTTVISYVYDPLGRRIAKKVNGATVEKYLWSGLTTLLAVYDGIDNLVMRFEYADGRMPVSMTRGGATYYLSYDQVGTLRAVYAADGTLVKRLDYDTFGNVLDDSNPGFAMPFGFAGGLRDSDTDLVHFGYRDYSPETGRWFQKDPIGFAGGDVNLYGYCLDDPVNFVDPTGEITGNELAEAQEAIAFLEEYWPVISARLSAYQSLLNSRLATLLGKIGESGFIKNAEKITVNGRDRIPDFMDKWNETIGEAKNVCYQAYTQQLRDFVQWAGENGYDFVLRIRAEGTRLSRPLQKLVDDGVILLQKTIGNRD